MIVLLEKNAMITQRNIRISPAISHLIVLELVNFVKLELSLCPWFDASDVCAADVIVYEDSAACLSFDSTVFRH
jgi:hypothetical protein